MELGLTRRHAKERDEDDGPRERGRVAVVGLVGVGAVGHGGRVDVQVIAEGSKLCVDAGLARVAVLSLGCSRVSSELVSPPTRSSPPTYIPNFDLNRTHRDTIDGRPTPPPSVLRPTINGEAGMLIRGEPSYFEIAW